MTWALKAAEDSVGSKGRGGYIREQDVPGRADTIRRWRWTGQWGRDDERSLGIGADTLGQGQLEGFPLNARLKLYPVCHRL